MRCLIAALLSAALASAPRIPSQVLDAVIAGRVLSAATGDPVPYALVTAPAADRRVFSRPDGSFHISLPMGYQRLRIAQIGYDPRDTTLNVSGVASLLEVQLAPRPAELRRIVVTGKKGKCRRPGFGPAALDGELAKLMETLALNAERFLALSEAFPMVYDMERVVDDYDARERRRSHRVDTVTNRSSRLWTYRPGEVIEDSATEHGRETRLLIPQLSHIADSTFQANHCFRYAGRAQVRGRPLHRVDFVPVATLKQPDVEGSLYLDEETVLVREARFRLVNVPNRFGNLESVEVVTRFREVHPTLLIIEHIESTSVAGERGSRYVSGRETQRLLEHRYLRGRPDDPK